jgi:rhodanese-related sulfurtransferase
MTPKTFPVVSPSSVRADLLAHREIALIDVREEAAHATGHPLFAANLPLSRIEIEVYARIPRRQTRIVLLDNGEGSAVPAANVLATLGYTAVSLLEGDIDAWTGAGYQLFTDVNAPSKAFGELVESRRHTPSFSAQEVLGMLRSNTDCVYVDVRRYDEFQTMSIPGATSLPGGELVLRIRELAPRPETQIIVNCAGRTRSIIGTQSLVNAGIPNPVGALRNGTIGWKLAQQQLDHGASRYGGSTSVSLQTQSTAAQSAREVADRASVRRMSIAALKHQLLNDAVTTYCFDVRTPEEFFQSHLEGFRNIPGGQLVQETEMYASVRGAQIVLADTDGVRANMTASWLAQMGWHVSVLDGITVKDFDASGLNPLELPPLPRFESSVLLDARQLRAMQAADPSVAILDLSPSQVYKRGHIPGAWFALRSHLEEAFEQIATAAKVVLTSPDGILAQFALGEIRAIKEAPVFLLENGNEGWKNAGFKLTDNAPRFASRPVDRYQRPYEGTEATEAAMQAYLDWEAGLVEQLNRDATHGFYVI